MKDSINLFKLSIFAMHNIAYQDIRSNGTEIPYYSLITSPTSTTVLSYVQFTQEVLFDYSYEFYLMKL